MVKCVHGFHLYCELCGIDKRGQKLKPGCSTAELEARIAALETVLQMVKDNDIAKYMRCGEYGNGELIRKEIDRVLSF